MTATQNGRLIHWLQTHNGITTFEAMFHLGIARLSERIRELEYLGYVIEHRAEKTSGGVRVVRYILISEPESLAA